MWFRAILTSVAVMSLVFLGWMATHISLSPVVLDRWSWIYTGLLGVLALFTLLLLLLAGPLYVHVHVRRFNVCIFVISSILTFGLAEAAFRSLDLFGMSYYRVANLYARNMLPDADLVYKHTPNSVAEYGDIEVEINSLGMRDREVLDKEPDEYRILFLGDSVTFGWGVAENQVFVRRLESILSEQIGRRVRTLNSGVGSYNTVVQWEFLKRHGQQLNPDLVVLVYVPNDISIKRQEALDLSVEQRPPVLVGWVLRESWLYSAMMHFRHIGQAAATNAQEAVLETDGWELSDRALRKIAKWCEDHDLPFVTYLARMTEEPQTDAILTGLRKAGTEQQFPTFDAHPWFSGTDIRTITNSAVDAHPNAVAHALYAEGIAATLKNAKIIEH